MGNGGWLMGKDAPGYPRFLRDPASGGKGLALLYR